MADHEQNGRSNSSKVCFPSFPLSNMSGSKQEKGQSLQRWPPTSINRPLPSKMTPNTSRKRPLPSKMSPNTSRNRLFLQGWPQIVSALVLMRILVQLFISMRTRIQGAKSMAIHADPDPGQTLPSQKLYFDKKNILYVLYHKTYLRNKNRF